MAQIDIEKLIRNPNARINIVGPGVRVSGFVEDDLSISGSNEYNNPFENAAQNDLNQKLQGLSSIVGRIGGEGVSNVVRNFSIKTIEQSSLFWTGSSTPSFTVPLTFIALRPGQDVRDDVQSLYSTVMPNFTNIKATSVVRAPLGYLPQGRSAVGTLVVEIGGWFRGTKMVASNVEFKFSKQLVRLPNGNHAPLFATGSFQFRTYRSISYQEFVGMLRGGGTSGGTT